MLNAITQLLGSTHASTTEATVDPPSRIEEDSFGAFSVDEYRPMKVVIIGAGASGIFAAIRFRQYIPNVQLVVYEQNDGIGGTWHVNKYPGVACDVPAHAYQFSFEQKHDWSSMWSPGSEILAYIQGVAKKYKVEPYVKLRHQLTGATYDEDSGKWNLRIKRPAESPSETLEEIDEWADFVFSGIGVLHRWNWPDIAGLKDFKGIMVHSADWNLGGATWEDDVKDWGDKKVGVVGLGSSALQIVGALGPKVGKLHHVVRGKAWIVPSFMTHVYQEKLHREVDPLKPETFTFTEEEKKSFEDPARLLEWRRSLEQVMNGMHKITLKGTPEQEFARNVCTQHVQKGLQTKPEYTKYLTPDFSVCSRRMTPAPGFLNAMCEDNYHLVNSPIARITPHGIDTEDGKHIDLDIIICATGFDTTYRFPFPIVGRNGVELQEKWTPHPTTYLSICVDGFPNMFFSNGPNSAVGTTGINMMMEHQVQYAVMCAMKLQRERLKSIEPKAEAITDFEKYMEDYFKKSVWSESVSSWYKPYGPDGRVVGIWPGSALHHFRTLRYPRWEDFNYERVDNTSNRFFWFGNGMTDAENSTDKDRTWYLDTKYADAPAVPAEA